MKSLHNLLLTLLLLAISLPAMAQFNPMCRPVTTGDSLDCVRLVAVYKMTFLSDPSDTTRHITDEIWLEIGDRVQKQYSAVMYDLDLKAEESEAPISFNTGGGQLPIVLYSGLPEAKELTLDYRLSVDAPVMRYSEPTPRIEWQLGSEKKTVAGIECQSATGDFGGRTWTAWFAPSLAYPYGPYKLGGLPGLILELHDQEREYNYVCIGFRPQEEGRPILEWKWDQQPTTKADLDKLVRSMYATPETTIKALGVNVVMRGDPMIDEPYNPIER